MSGRDGEAPPDDGPLPRLLRRLDAWRGRPVVVKLGGSVLDDASARPHLRDLALLHGAGVRVTVVHGGGAAVSGLMERLGREPRFVDGLRVTDDATMELVEMALAGRANKRLVAALQAAGAPAVGISGLDGGLLRAAPHPDARRLGRVGRPDGADPGLLSSLHRDGYLPVVAPVAGDEEGGSWNVNADAAAGALAAAVRAARLVLVTDVPGVRGPDGGEVVPELGPDAARGLVESGVAARGMAPKLEACASAVESGVGGAHVVGAGRRRALLVELLTGAVVGTTVRRREGPSGGPASGTGPEARRTDPRPGRAPAAGAAPRGG